VEESWKGSEVEMEEDEVKTHFTDLCRESLFECRKIEGSYIGVCDKGIDRCRKCREDSMCNVWDQVKTTVYGISTKDRHFQDVRGSVHVCSYTGQKGEE
jgi:hypothetical protein